jgi:ribose/xylose/arabinose/galactoside ABC-type transport system permease subunit
VKRQLKEIRSPLIGAFVITGAIALLAPSFRQQEAFVDVLENAAVLFIMCTGMTIALIGNCLDLSVGSIYALASVVAGQLLISGVPWPICIVAGLGAGVVCGVINGLIVVYMGVPTLIATLGTQMIFRGVANMIGAGKDMSHFGPEFDWIGQGLIGPMVVCAIAFFTIWFILSKTKLGYQAYAQGGNEEVARLAGIPVKRNIIVIYVICGTMAALASIVYTARVDFAYVNRGQGIELWAIAGVVIGGTSMFGGVGGVGKTIIGVWIFYVLQAGLIHLHFEAFWQQIATGAVIIIAVWLDFLQRRAEASRKASLDTATKRSLWTRVTGIRG